MFSVLGKSGVRILRHMSPASTKGPWTMKFIFSQLHLSTVSLLKGSNMCMCAHFSVRECLQCGLALSPSCSLPLDIIPTLLAKITLSGLLISLSLSFSFSHCVFQRSSPPSLPPALYTSCYLTDLSNRHQDRQTSV